MGNNSSSEGKKDNSSSSSSSHFKGVNGVPFDEGGGGAQKSSNGPSSSSAAVPPPPPAQPSSSYDSVLSTMSDEDILKETAQLAAVIAQLEVDLIDAKEERAMIIEFNKQRVDELDEELAWKYKETELEIKAKYRADLKAAADEKDEELEEEIEFLNSVVFPERAKLVYEDLRSKILVRDLEREWAARHVSLLDLQRQDLATIRKIAQQEHDKVFKTVTESLEKEHESFVANSKKRGGGLLGFFGFSPSKKSRREEEEDADIASEASDD